MLASCAPEHRALLALLLLHANELVLLGSFGFARGLITLPMSLSEHKFAVLDRLSPGAERLRIGETALLIGVAASFLA